MLANSFIDYLLEKRIVDKNDNLLYFLLPKKVNDSGQVNEIIDCLKTCLEKLKSDPKDFVISDRGINLPTLEYIFKNILKIDVATPINVYDNKVKKHMLEYILSLPLHASFNKSMPSISRDKRHSGWVYIFIVKNVFNPELTVRVLKDNEKSADDPRNIKDERKGSMLYLKFNFKSYKEAPPNSKGNVTKIVIDPKSLKLDIISCHPTSSDK